ncbi:hypothetical protein [Sigmofec virus UA08Rod_5707]|uniref:Uncharacterized protein n=1 Tax=Sigmofec virus UA08Rod_5707 TaxID=2929437 RepID=A0A976N0K4_9VIRU|nr:hypothetical protein [Sigmofec virus UA08Rod_5707]
MANAKRYSVSVNGDFIFTGPVRSAEMVYTSVCRAYSILSNAGVPVPPVFIVIRHDLNGKEVK